MTMKLFWKKDPKKALDKLLEGCEVPTFPQVTLRILERLRDPDTSPRRSPRRCSGTRPWSSSCSAW